MTLTVEISPQLQNEGFRFCKVAKRDKNPVAQVNELLAKIVAYNLTVVIHEMYENGINPEFLPLK